MLGKAKGGASTIDMQFVRTATGYKEKTLRRKWYEMLLAVLIQYRYSKPQILRSYLDCAFFGSGLVGAHQASLRMFSGAPGELTSDSAAQVAAMLVYPRPLRPEAHWIEKIQQRGRYGLARLERSKERFEKL